MRPLLDLVSQPHLQVDVATQLSADEMGRRGVCASTQQPVLPLCRSVPSWQPGQDPADNDETPWWQTPYWKESGPLSDLAEHSGCPLDYSRWDCTQE